MKNEPLGLPRGSVRAFLALLLVGAGITLAYMQVTVPEWLIASIATVIGTYFTGRNQQPPPPPPAPAYG